MASNMSCKISKKVLPDNTYFATIDSKHIFFVSGGGAALKIYLSFNEFYAFKFHFNLHSVLDDKRVRPLVLVHYENRRLYERFRGAGSGG